MIIGLHTSANALGAQQRYLDTTANNLANINTYGFKRRRTDFEDLVYNTPTWPGTFGAIGREIPTGIQIGHGTPMPSTTLEFQQGPLEVTNDELDVAIQGDGFFAVQLGEGNVAYTRDGTFQLDANRQLTLVDGFLLQPPVTVPPGATQISIAPTGEVTALVNNQPVLAGQIQLTHFANPAGLIESSFNLFQVSPNSGPPVVANPGSGGNGILIQGSRERSNVEVVSELLQLTIAQRAFEANSRTFQTTDEMVQTANDIINP